MFYLCNKNRFFSTKHGPSGTWQAKVANVPLAPLYSATHKQYETFHGLQTHTFKQIQSNIAITFRKTKILQNWLSDHPSSGERASGVRESDQPVLSTALVMRQF